MDKYKFYYDESEHSRKINYTTVTASNYYDNFIAVVIGWQEKREKHIFEKYEEFENKYSYRKDKNGELKSNTLKQKKLKFGFASLDEDNAQFVMDFLSIFDENTKLYFSVTSKIEYLVLQIFKNYNNNLFRESKAFMYSITKTIINYRPENVIKCIYENSNDLVKELKKFFRERIEFNRLNMDLKEQENKTFEKMLRILNNVSPILELQWNYCIPFFGFSKYLQEQNINNYVLIIDKEGEQDQPSNTMQAACQIGLKNVTEKNSQVNSGLRIADMMAGIISKLLKALHNQFCYYSFTEKPEKKLLDTKWFSLKDYQFNLYKKLYKIIYEWNNIWYKSYYGIYSDDLISFLSLLLYMNNFENAKQIIDEELEKQNEYFNRYVCNFLTNYFNHWQNKLPIDFVCKSNKKYFLNRRGAKVYYDITKQPVLQIKEGSKTETVLSIGIHKSGIPLITIFNKNNPVCYQLPNELNDWAYRVIEIANMRENLFPKQVIFTKNENKYFVYILLY